MNEKTSTTERQTRERQTRERAHAPRAWRTSTSTSWRWLIRTLTGSSAGTAPFEYVVVAGACSLGCLIAFKHFGTSLEAHERLQAERIHAPKLPSADEYVNGMGAAIERPRGDDDNDDDETDDDNGDLPQCRLDGTCPGNGQCFAAGTPVATEHGLRQIESLRAGERVWARDVESGELALKRITHTFVRQDTPVIDLELRAGALSEAEHLAVTPSHRFWVEGTGWQRAEELVSTSIWSPEKPFFATALAQESEPTTVYNLEVEGFHSYFVGWSRVLVHNGDDDPDENDCPERTPLITPKCFKRRSSAKGLDGYNPRRVYDEDEAIGEPGLRPVRDAEDNILYWEADDELRRKLMRKEEDRQLAAQQAVLDELSVGEFLDRRDAWDDRRRRTGDGRPDDDNKALADERNYVYQALTLHHLRTSGVPVEQLDKIRFDLIYAKGKVTVMDEVLKDIDASERPGLQAQLESAMSLADTDIAGTNPLHKLDGAAGGKETMHGLGNELVNMYIGAQWPSRVRAIRSQIETGGFQRGALLNIELRYCD